MYFIIAGFVPDVFFLRYPCKRCLRLVSVQSTDIRIGASNRNGVIMAEEPPRGSYAIKCAYAMDWRHYKDIRYYP